MSLILMSSMKAAENSADDGRIFGGGAITGEVREDDTAQDARRKTFGTSHAGAETKEDGGVNGAAQDEIGDGDVFDECAVDGLERKATATIEDAVRDGDRSESAVRFRAALDATHCFALLRVIGALQRAVEYGAELVEASDIAVRDGNVFSCTCVAEREGAFGADGVVPGRVDGAVGDSDSAATVDVDAIAVGVDGETVNDDVVGAGEQDPEVTTHEDREVA